MPLFAVIGLDDLSSFSSKRGACLAEHRAYLKEHDEHMLLVGPLRDEHGSSCGSLYVMQADSPSEIQDWFSREPFFKAGVYRELLIRRFDPVMSRLPPRTWLGDGSPRS